jgi:hypothetical protein
MPVCIGSLHRLALDDAGSLELGRRSRSSRSRPCRRAGCRAGRRSGRAGRRRPGSRAGAGALDGVALDDLLPVAEQHGADVVGLEVQREAGDVMRQLEHLEGHRVLEAVDASDAVGDRQHGADLGERRRCRVEALDAALEDAGDFVWVDLHVRLRLLASRSLSGKGKLGGCLYQGFRRRLAPGRLACVVVQDGCDRGVEDRSCRRADDATEDLGVDPCSSARCACRSARRCLLADPLLDRSRRRARSRS